MPFSGERLKQSREKKGLTQRQLASLSGMNEVQLSRYENGKMEPSVRYLELIAKHLTVSADYLVGLTDDPYKRYGDTEISDSERAILDTYRREGWPGVFRLGAERISK